MKCELKYLACWSSGKSTGALSAAYPRINKYVSRGREVVLRDEAENAEQEDRR
jgi:hypothetical protein